MLGLHCLHALETKNNKGNSNSFRADIVSKLVATRKCQKTRAIMGLTKGSFN